MAALPAVAAPGLEQAVPAEVVALSQAASLVGAEYSERSPGRLAAYIYPSWSLIPGGAY